MHRATCRPIAVVPRADETKFIGGHSDLLAGVVTVRRDDLRAALRRSRELNGATPGALESFLAVRGARTMALRLERAQGNAMALAERLHAHPRVALTRYPGLITHPTHAIARAQLRGFGTIISFDLRCDAAAADEVFFVMAKTREPDQVAIAPSCFINFVL